MTMPRESQALAGEAAVQLIPSVFRAVRLGQ